MTNIAADRIRMLDIKHRQNIIKLIEALAVNPRPPGAVKLEGMTGLYREQINSFRLIYKVDEQEILILLVK
jgi:mRNA interferase RelE/StbE